MRIELDVTDGIQRGTQDRRLLYCVHAGSVSTQRTFKDLLNRLDQIRFPIMIYYERTWALRFAGISCWPHYRPLLPPPYQEHASFVDMVATPLVTFGKTLR